MKTQTNEHLFTTINESAKLTGLARGYIRKLCREGAVPCLRIGDGNNATYMINYEKLLTILDKLSDEGARKDDQV